MCFKFKHKLQSVKFINLIIRCLVNMCKSVQTVNGSYIYLVHYVVHNHYLLRKACLHNY